MIKRIGIFLAVNALVVLTISIVLSVLNVQPYLTRQGLNLQSLLIFCLVWGMVGAGISLALSRIMAKSLMGVTVIAHSGPHKQLYQLVERLARDAGLPQTPEVGIFQSADLNAFATGPSKRRSLVAVSSTLLQTMDEEELEAILGHEIAHISNGDMVTMTLIQGVVNAFVMFLARVVAYAISSIGRGQKERGSYMSYYLMTFVFEILFMILGSLVVAFFSRQREYRADYESSLLTRKEFMIRALQKLDHTRPSAKQPTSIQALMISTPRKSRWLQLFSTHPSIEERITRLEES